MLKKILSCTIIGLLCCGMTAGFVSAKAKNKINPVPDKAETAVEIKDAAVETEKTDETVQETKETIVDVSEEKSVVKEASEISLKTKVISLNNDEYTLNLAGESEAFDGRSAYLYKTDDGKELQIDKKSGKLLTYRDKNARTDIANPVSEDIAKEKAIAFLSGMCDLSKYELQTVRTVNLPGDTDVFVQVIWQGKINGYYSEETVSANISSAGEISSVYLNTDKFIDYNINVDESKVEERINNELARLKSFAPAGTEYVVNSKTLAFNEETGTSVMKCVAATYLNGVDTCAVCQFFVDIG